MQEQEEPIGRALAGCVVGAAVMIAGAMLTAFGIYGIIHFLGGVSGGK